MTVTEHIHTGRFARWMAKPNKRGWRWEAVTRPQVFGTGMVIHWWFGKDWVAEMTSDRFLRRRRHELAHVEQARRMGRWTWLVTILWEYVRYGYEHAPLEVEAREAERAA